MRGNLAEGALLGLGVPQERSFLADGQTAGDCTLLASHEKHTPDSYAGRMRYRAPRIRRSSLHRSGGHTTPACLLPVKSGLRWRRFPPL